MTEYYRALTNSGEMTVISAPTGLDSIRHLYMWVDDSPVDLRPAQYPDTKLVELGDLVVCGGVEFTVASFSPAWLHYEHGQIRGTQGPWYSVTSAVLLSRARV